jgi:hypothetical protein
LNSSIKIIKYLKVFMAMPLMITADVEKLAFDRTDAGRRVRNWALICPLEWHPNRVIKALKAAFSLGQQITTHNA